MWFRNLLPYRLDGEWKMSPGALENRLANHVLQPCTGLSAQSQGWTSPRDNDQLVYGQERHLLFSLGTETKILPASVIKDAVQEKAARIEKNMGYAPGRKQLREIREEVTAELLPKAFARRASTRVWIDPESGWLLTDTASVKRSDEILSQLRETLGNCPFHPLDARHSPSAVMTRWLSAGSASGNFSLDQDCELKSTGDEPSAIKFSRHGLEGDEVRRHLKEGNTVTRLGLIWNDRIRFVLGDQGELRRIRFEMIEEDRAENEDVSSSEDERFDTDFALMTGELRGLLGDLLKALGGDAKSE